MADVGGLGAGGVGDVVTDPLIRSVAHSLMDQQDVLTDEMVRRIVGGDRFYAQAASLRPDEIRVDVENLLLSTLRGLAGLEPLEFELTRDMARRRAEEGLPVAMLLHAYRMCAQVIWEHYFAAGHRVALGEFDVDQILGGANQLWGIANAYCSVISQAYDDTASDRARRSERERMLLLDALFDGRLDDLPPMATAARLLDLPERDSFVVVVAERADDGIDALPRIDQVFRREGRRSAWRLTSQYQIGVVVVGSTPDAITHLHKLIGDRAAGRVGVSPMYEELADTGRHVNLAALALGCVPPATTGVAGFDDHPLGVIVGGSPDLSRRVARTLLGPVLALDDDERTVLLDTFRMWMTHGGSTAVAAEHLYCHRNTVRNRLQRVESLTGRSLTDPVAVTELCLAVTTLTLHPITTG